MALLWLIIYGVIGFVCWKVYTSLSITQKRNALLNIAMVILLIGACGIAYELLTSGKVGVLSSPY